MQGRARTAISAAGAALVAVAALAGCGGSGSGSASGYCGDVGAAQRSIVRLSLNEITQADFERLAGSLHAIRDEAPGDVKAPWTTFSGAVDSFRSALRRSGMTMDQLAQMQTGRMASGPAMERAMAAARSFSSLAVANAESAIATQVKSTCHLDLYSGG